MPHRPMTPAGPAYTVRAIPRTDHGDRAVQLARVRGNVVASIKAGGLAAHKLLVLERVAAEAPQDSAGETFVAIDLAGAGVGEIVLVAIGSAARIDADGQHAPTDAAVIAIVDAVSFDGRTTFNKR